MLANVEVHHSKLFGLLKTLSKKEAKDFGLWLASPLHNSNLELIQLYKGIRHKNSMFTRPIDKLTLLQYLGKSIDPNQTHLSPSEEKTIREAMYRLTVQVQDFMAWIRFKENGLTAKHKLMDLLVDRKLYKYVPRLLEKAKKDLETAPYRGMDYCEHSFLLAEIDFSMGMVQHNRSPKKEIQNLIDCLRQASISKLLKYYCAAKSHEKILKVEYDYPLIEAIKQQVAQSEDKQVPMIWVYYVLLLLLEEGEAQYYYDLKSYLIEHSSAFSAFELRQFFNHITNYCNWMVKQGHNEFIRELHEIFKHGLALKCWTAGVYFSTHQFVHIVKNALKLDEVDWAVTFIQHHKYKLAPDAKLGIPHYCFALMAFHSNNFDRAQDLLLKIQSSEDFAYDIEFRVLLIKIYYEQNQLTPTNLDTHPLNFEIEALRQNVSNRNKKMTAIFRQAYNNFVNVFKRILDRKKKLIFGHYLSKEQLMKLEREIPMISPLIERDWLVGKVQQLLDEIT